MKDLILNFSWDKLISLPPTEMLAFAAIVLIAIIVLVALLAALVSLIEG